MSMTRTLIICSIVVLSSLSLGGAPVRAEGQREEARKHFLQGKAHFKQGKYLEAIKSFEAAGRIKPSSILDYNIGRCHAELGNHELGIAAFKRYLEGKPNAPNKEEVLDRIAKLKAARKKMVEEQPPPEPEPSSAPTQPQPEPSPQLQPPAAVEEPGVPGTDQQGNQNVAGGTAEPQHEAALPPQWSPQAEQQRSRSKQPRPQPSKKDKAPSRPKEGPIYKQWWFWVACAGAAVILGFVIGTAASKNETSSQARGLTISF
jgi:tetratricopeptide (TPR) repeat protein